MPQPESPPLPRTTTSQSMKRPRHSYPIETASAPSALTLGVGCQVRRPGVTSAHRPTGNQSIPITLYHQLKCGLPSGFPNSICPSTSSQRAHGKPAKSKPFARSSIKRHNASRGDFTQTSQPQPSGTGQRSLTETHHSEPSGFFALDRRAAAT